MAKRGAGQLRCLATRPTRLRYDHAGRRGAPVTRRWGSYDTALGRLAIRCDKAGWAATTRPQQAMIRPCVRPPVRACALLGVLAGQQAVHLVHPACFWTQYCF